MFATALFHFFPFPPLPPLAPCPAPFSDLVSVAFSSSWGKECFKGLPFSHHDHLDKREEVVVHHCCYFKLRQVSTAYLSNSRKYLVHTRPFFQTSRSRPSFKFMRMVGSLRSSTTVTLVAIFRLVFRTFFVFQKNMKLRKLWQFSVIGSKV